MYTATHPKAPGRAPVIPPNDGSGANSRHAIATGVMGGMVGATSPYR